jgi:uncharacterized protein (DUF2249 family)
MQRKIISASPKAKSHNRAIAPLELDIRPIFAAGTSPCGTIDTAVAGLRPGQSLILLAPFEPVPLFAKLAAQGFEHRSEELSDGSWKILFEPSGTAAPAKSTPQSCCCSGQG